MLVKMKDRVAYDDVGDSLIISRKLPNEKVKQNFMFDDLVFSLTNSGRIVGLEVNRATNFLKESGINPSILGNINGASLNIVEKREMVLVNFVLNSKDVEQVVPVTRLPLQAIAL